MAKTVVCMRLSAAQVSAIECSGVLDATDERSDDDQALDDALANQGAGRTVLVLGPTTAMAVYRALTELANGEDAEARRQRRGGDPHTAGMAARACRSLTCVAAAVLRLADDWDIEVGRA